MRKNFYKVVAVTAVVAMCLNSVLMVSAANYIQPFVWDVSPGAETVFNAGSKVADEGKTFFGGYSNFGATGELHSRVMVSSVDNGADTSNNVKIVGGRNGDPDDYYYKLQYNSAAAGKNISFDYNVADNTGAKGTLGFNAVAKKSGNIYGKATFQMDFMIEKNEAFWETNTARTDKNIAIRLFGADTPSSNSDAVAAMFMTHRASWDATDDNKDRFVITSHGSYSSVFQNNLQYEFLNLGTWYTLKMDVDVPAQKVTYDILNMDGMRVSTTTVYEADFLNAKPFVSPVLSIESIDNHGFDYSFDNIKITRETFVIGDTSITETGVTEDVHTVTATAQVANDIYLSGSDAAPRLIIAAYDKTKGNLVKMDISEETNISRKALFNAALAYQTLTASITLDQAMSAYDVRAYICAHVIIRPEFKNPVIARV